MNSKTGTLPNIVITIADDQQHDTVGSARFGPVQTPALDALAQRGTSFTHCHMQGSVAQAVCAPSRAMLHTGRNLFDLPASMLTYACASDVELLRTPDADAPLLGELLQHAGYHTHLVGKWHNGPQSAVRSFTTGDAIFLGGMKDQFRMPVSRLDRGAGKLTDPTTGTQHSTDLFTDAAVRFLEQRPTSQPFLLYVAFTAPHDPRTPAPPFDRIYRHEDMPLPPNFLPAHPFDNGELEVRDEKLAPRPRDPDDIRRHLAGYYGMVSQMDAGIGRIHAAIEAAGLADNTIVIHTSDHGLAVGRHGLLGKQNMYDHSVRVPLIVAGPGVARGARADALCYLHDLFATLCEQTGIAVPPGCSSRSLAPLLQAPARSHRDRVFGAYRGFQRMIRVGQWKLAMHLSDPVRGTQLFDLAADPWEMRNLADDPAFASVRRDLREALFASMRELGDPQLPRFQSIP